MSNPLKIVSLFLAIVISLNVLSAHRGPSDKPFSVNPPFFRDIAHLEKPEPLWGSVKRPYPTSAHWTNFVLEDGILPAAPLPFVMNAFPQGPVISYPRVHCVEPACFGFPTMDVSVGAEEINESSRHEVVDYDSLSLTMQWHPAARSLSLQSNMDQLLKLKDSCDGSVIDCQVVASCINLLSNLGQVNPQPICHCPEVPEPSPPIDIPIPPIPQPVEPEPTPTPTPTPSPTPSPPSGEEEGVVYGIPSQRMTVHMVYGSPFVTIKYGGLKPIFGSQNSIMEVNDQRDDKIFTGSKFSVYFNTGNRYVIFAVDGPITLHWDGNHLRAESSYNGVIRIAPSPTVEHDKLLEKHAVPYAIAAAIRTSFSGNEGHIQFDWISEGGDANNLLMVTLPHQRDVLQGVHYLSPVWKSLKGDMVPIVGSSWKMIEPLTSISWNSAHPIAPHYIDAVRAALLEDAYANVGIPSDTYSFGKVASRFARLALIADQVGEVAARDHVLSGLRDILTPWFEVRNNNHLLYDTVWGGIISQNGRDDRGAEFGQGWYNDQHFHFGYFMYASAVLSHFDTEWRDAHRAAIDDMARNIANPSPADHFYPISRHKDWYVGHSWASGLFPFGDAKNQESTSESVNGYYGIYLWGLAIGDAHVRDWGRLLMQTEIRSTQKYWHMDPADTSIYSSPFVEHTCIGIVWNTKVDYATWFGLEVEYIHAIQMLPYTPITEELLPAKWIRVEYPVLRESLTRKDPIIQEGWRGFVFMTESIIAKEEAWAHAQTLTSYDNGNSKANTLYFIATRP